MAEGITRKFTALEVPEILKSEKDYSTYRTISVEKIKNAIEKIESQGFQIEPNKYLLHGCYVFVSPKAMAHPFTIYSETTKNLETILTFLDIPTE